MLHKNSQKLSKRLKIIQGQVGGVEKMLSTNKYCPDIIRQSLAIQKSLQSFNQALLENHLQEHISHQFHTGKEKQAIKELSEIYSLTNK